MKTLSTRIRSVSTRIAYAGLILTTLCLTGCHNFSQYGSSCCSWNSGMDRMLTSKFAHCDAKFAWLDQRDGLGGCSCMSDVKRGFMCGFRDVAMGGDGRIPAVPDAYYWGWRARGADSASRVAAWYRGYPLGAAAAEQRYHSYRLSTPFADLQESGNCSSGGCAAAGCSTEGCGGCADEGCGLPSPMTSTAPIGCADDGCATGAAMPAAGWSAPYPQAVQTKPAQPQAAPVANQIQNVPQPTMPAQAPSLHNKAPMPQQYQPPAGYPTQIQYGPQMATPLAAPGHSGRTNSPYLTR